MAGGTWDDTALPIRPGLYINFVEAAAAAIKGGARGIVAIPLFTYSGGTATAKQMYTVEGEKQASELFGAANIKPITFALNHGAKEVLVYTMPATPAAQDYINMRDAYDAYTFNIFVFPDVVTATEQDNTAAWVATNRTDGKHFIYVAGCVAVADDQDITVGNARSTGFNDDYVVNLVSGVIINGVTYNSAQFAPAIAGLIAGLGINKSITYKQVKVDDVTKRLTNSQIKSGLQAGSLVLVNDGTKVKVEQGICTSKEKVRAIRARQAVATDIPATAAEAYIGVLDNNEDGRASLISACKVYLERLALNNVLTDPIVIVDPDRPPVGDSVWLFVSYVEVDSMERIFLTISI